MGKDSFIFYKTWFEILEDERQEVQWEVINAVLKYVFCDNLVELKPNSKMAFKFIKRDIDRANENHQMYLEKQRINGSRGGRPRNPKNPVVILETQETHNVNENVNENVNDISFNKEIVFNFKKEFLKIGLQEKFINEWLKIRKAKKLVNTETAFKKFLTEFQKTDMEINSLFENYIIPKSWGGFESDWLNKDKKLNGISANNNSNNKQSERIMQNLATAARLAKKFESEGIAVNPMGK